MPEWERLIRTGLAALNLQGAREAEIVEELAEHLEDRYRELLGSGTAKEEALALALDELESHELLAANIRTVPGAPAIGLRGGGNIMEGIWQDLKVAWRMIRMKPWFSAGVIGMLALGVAGNAAIFSIFNGLFLRPLPFAEPERLVDVDETAPKWNLEYTGVSNPDYAAWQQGNSTFDSMAFFMGGGDNLTTADGAAQRIRSGSVTHNLLDVLGLKPVVGRNFLPEEDRPGGAPVAMLGYDLWQRLFHGDPAAVGQVLKLDERPYTIVGVLPREAVLPPDAELWRPLQADVTRGGGWYLRGVGRLKHGVTIEPARADLERVHRANPKAANATSPTIGPLRDRYLGPLRTVTRILLAAVGVVLLIACVNIAGLMLVRGEGRSREIAIRAAVGASRARVIRQLLTESAVLAGLGGVAGVVLGKIFLNGLVSLMPTDLPRWLRFDLDGRFALFCIAATGAAAILFGLAPALQAAAVDARSSLQEATHATISRGKRAVLSVLVVGEIALALMLLISSGLLVQAFRKVLHVDPGFRAENVLTFSIRLPQAKYEKAEQRLAFFNGLVERLKAVPGASAVSGASIVPLNGHQGDFYQVEGGREFQRGELGPVTLRIVALPGYFETMGMMLLSGRGFEARDQLKDAPRVAVVSETFAKFHCGTTDVTGRLIKQGKGKDRIQIVGVIRDVRHYGLDGVMRPSVIQPYEAGTAGLGLALVMRGSADLTASAREVVRQVDPDLPMFDVRSMAERLERSLWVRRAYSWLFGAFAVVAILLAAAGIYGVIAFTVSQRTREIGIRIALGARPGQVMTGVLRSGMALVATGIAAGLAAVWFTTRFLETLLFGVSHRDTATYVGVIAGVVLVGLAANYVPARRASEVDPMRALRAE